MRSIPGFLLLALTIFIGTGAVRAADSGHLGAELKDLTTQEAEALGWEDVRGSKIISPGSGTPAAGAGLLPGDIVVSADGVEITNTKGFMALIQARTPGSELQLRIKRGGKERRVAVKLGKAPSTAAASAATDTRPIPMLDTGGHMALIRDIAFTPDGKRIVSGGDDKVIRIWDIESGQTIQTIRGYVGPGPEGKNYSMALSPDGKTLAAAGWTNPQCVGRCGDVRIFDMETGQLKVLLTGHTDVVNTLTFSRDGRLLVSGGADKTAIVWDMQQMKARHRLVGHTDYLFASAFTPDGQRVVTGGDDSTVRLWRVSDGTLVAEMTGHKHKVRAIDVSPADGTIASGDRGGEIRYWNGTTGQFIKPFAQQAATTVGSLTFSPDGRFLVSTCGQGHPCYDHVWDAATGIEIATHKIDDNIVLATAFSPDGLRVASGGGRDQEIHIWDPKTGVVEKVLKGTGRPVWATAISPDNRSIAWGNLWASHTTLGQNPLHYKLRLPAPGEPLGAPESLEEKPGGATGVPPAGGLTKTGTPGASVPKLKPESGPMKGDAAQWLRANTKLGNWALQHRPGGKYGLDAILDIMKDGKAQASIQRDSSEGDDHRAYAFIPDGNSLVSGGSFGVLASYNLQGQKLGNYMGHVSDIWAVTPSADGRLVVSGADDQTVRVWNTATRELIVTIFNGRDGEWVMWTPQGYYTGSPGADKIIGWQINKGTDKTPDFVAADQLRQHLNRPDIIDRAIILASAEAAIKEAPGTTFVLADLLRRPVPRYRIVKPANGAIEYSGRTLIELAIEESPDPVKIIRVQVDGRQVSEIISDQGGFPKGTQLLDVPLGQGENEIRIAAINDIGETTQTLLINHEGPGALDKRGTLYVLSIGVDRYPSAKGALKPLAFAGKDARAFEQAMRMRLGPGHDKIISQLLVNDGGTSAPTASNIRNALDILREAKETDTIVVFLAGHGVNDGPNYRFLPTDAEPLGEGWKSDKAVTWYALEEVIQGAKGRRLLFVDTCHAGNAFNQRLGNASYHANVIAYSSARWDQQALERDDLGHGLFTYALVEGVGGQGDLDQDKKLGTKELHEYMVRRVDTLAKEVDGVQEPQYYRGRDADDYVLGKL